MVKHCGLLILFIATSAQAQVACLNPKVEEKFKEKVAAVCRARLCEKLKDFEACASALGLNGAGGLVAATSLGGIGAAIRSPKYQPCLLSQRLPVNQWELLADLLEPKALACINSKDRQIKILEKLKEETKTLLDAQQAETKKFYAESNSHWRHDLSRLGLAMDESAQNPSNRAVLQRRIGEIEAELTAKYKIGTPNEVKEFRQMMQEHLAARKNFDSLNLQIKMLDEKIRELRIRPMDQEGWSRFLEKVRPGSRASEAVMRQEMRSAMSASLAAGTRYTGGYFTRAAAEVIGKYGTRLALGPAGAVMAVAAEASVGSGNGGSTCSVAQFAPEALIDQSTCQFKTKLDDNSDQLCDLPNEQLNDYIQANRNGACEWFEQTYGRQYSFKAKCDENGVRVTTSEGDQFTVHTLSTAGDTQIQTIDRRMPDGRESQARFADGALVSVHWMGGPASGKKIPLAARPYYDAYTDHMVDILESMSCCGQTATKLDNETCARYMGTAASSQPDDRPAVK